MIFHVLTRADWESRRHEPVLAEPGPEGFVHCCDPHQLAHVRAKHFAPGVEVLALEIDPTQLDSETRYEPGSLGEAERFPHVYGVLPTSAVRSVTPVTAG